MSSVEFVEVYRRDLIVNIKVSKKVNEEARIKRLEKWPKEAGLSQPLEESGINFLQLVKTMASDYGLTTGDRSWSTKSENNKRVVYMEWKLNKDNQVKGLAKMNCIINLNPISEEGDNYVYEAQVEYKIEIANDVLTEKATTEGMPEFTL